LLPSAPPLPPPSVPWTRRLAMLQVVAAAVCCREGVRVEGDVHLQLL
jgi:hypothetical protein